MPIKGQLVGYAICRKTSDGYVEDAYFCHDIANAYTSLKFYRQLGFDVWLEPRHITTALS